MAKKTEKQWRRLSVVVDDRTERALRSISYELDESISYIVRRLIAEPAVELAEAVCSVRSARNDGSADAVLAKMDELVQAANKDYADSTKGLRHG